MSPDLKKKKSLSVRNNLRAAGSFASAQGMVWEEIEAKFSRMAAEPSPTRALSDLYDRNQDMAEEFLKAFRPVDNQVGMVVLIDGEIAGVEFLARFDAFKKNHPKLVHSYVMDALEKAVDKQRSEGKTSKEKVNKILQHAAGASIEKRKSVSLGQDIRLESQNIVGAGLEYEGQILQLTIFSNDAAAAPDGTRRSIRKASERRRSWERS